MRMIIALRFVQWAAFVGIVVCAGCTAKGPVRYPVHGRVSLQGKPLAEAMIVLHHVGGDVKGMKKPIATTDVDGHFTVSTMQSGDGAPIGKYAITIELRPPRQVGEEVLRDGRNLLPSKYQRPETSGVRCEVSEGNNEIPPIDLSRP